MVEEDCNSASPLRLSGGQGQVNSMKDQVITSISSLFLHFMPSTFVILEVRAIQNAKATKVRVGGRVTV